MKPLLKQVAFSAAYRGSWSKYFSHTQDGYSQEDLLNNLKKGLDFESREIIDTYASIVVNCHPSALFDCLYIDPKKRISLLPEKTKERLEKLGLLDERVRGLKLTALTRQLGLAETLLPEFLTHCGLAFIPKKSRQYITGGSVIDGGAYIGDSAALFAKYYNAKCVYAFEPDPESFNRLEKNIETWGMGAQIKAENAALHSHTGKMALWGDGVGTSTLEKVTVQDMARPMANTISIDEFATQVSLTDLGAIKLDIEGAEYDAIIGARKTITEFRPLMFLSIYHTARDFYEVKTIIESWNLGYKFLVRKMTDDLIKEIILICVPTDIE